MKSGKLVILLSDRSRIINFLKSLADSGTLVPDQNFVIIHSQSHIREQSFGIY